MLSIFIHCFDEKNCFIFTEVFEFESIDAFLKSYETKYLFWLTSCFCGGVLNFTVTAEQTKSLEEIPISAVGDAALL